MAQVSWFLLLCVSVMVVLLLAVNIYVLVHYSHPDDKNEAYLPKIMVVSCGDPLPDQNAISACRHLDSWLDCTPNSIMSRTILFSRTHVCLEG
jgi:hypothetical protein